jgi:hypothetical protein
LDPNFSQKELESSLRIRRRPEVAGTPTDDKASGPIFAGSLAFVAMSIPSIALLVTLYDKVAGVGYLQMRMEVLTKFAVIMMGTAAVASVLALLRLTGWNIPLGFPAIILAVLIVLAPLITLGIVFGYLS